MIFYFICQHEYEKTLKTNAFHKRIDFVKKLPTTTNANSHETASTKSLDSQSSFSAEEAFVFHSNSIMMHFTQANMLDEFGNLNVPI